MYKWCRMGANPSPSSDARDVSQSQGSANGVQRGTHWALAKMQIHSGITTPLCVSDAEHRQSSAQALQSVHWCCDRAHRCARHSNTDDAQHAEDDWDDWPDRDTLIPLNISPDEPWALSKVTSCKANGKAPRWKASYPPFYYQLRQWFNMTDFIE